MSNRHASDYYPESLTQDIDRVTRSILGDERTRHVSTAFLPDRREVIGILDRLFWLLFPGFYGPRAVRERALREHVASVMRELHDTLFAQVTGALRYDRKVESRSEMFDAECSECDARARQVVPLLLGAVPAIRQKLSLDVQAAFDGDPAAQHTDEVIFCYPGLRALAVHRIAHELYKMQVPLLPRIMSEHAHSQTGIDIHPGARIGKSFFIDHGTGVVIGETTVIGDHCKLYQGVTLGAKSFPKDERGRLKRGIKRHPTLEDHVTVYAGATILGGDTIIGAGSVVSGGVFLTETVPAGHVVRAPRVVLKLRSNPEMPPLMYDI